jgi:hypothetical protein
VALWDWDLRERWSFVVDTDQYAGNFERQLCAYVIGQVDDYARPMDRPYLQLFGEECRLRLEDLSECRVADPGDDGVTRAPWDLAPSPGLPIVYNSVAIFLNRRPTDQELQELIKRTLAFAKLPQFEDFDQRPKIVGCRLVAEQVALRVEQVWREK